MKSLSIFPELVWKVKFPGRLDKIITAVEEYKTLPGVHKNNNIGNGALQTYDTNYYPHEWPVLEEFNKWFAPNLEIVWKNWGLSLLPEQELGFTSWCNEHSKGQYTGEHTHPNDIMTVVFYPRKSDNSANLQVFDPLMQVSTSGKFWKDIPATSGDVVIIPGWMLHKVAANESDQVRLSITVNISIITKGLE